MLNITPKLALAYVHAMVGHVQKQAYYNRTTNLYMSKTHFYIASLLIIIGSSCGSPAAEEILAEENKEIQTAFANSEQENTSHEQNESLADTTAQRELTEKRIQEIKLWYAAIEQQKKDSCTTKKRIIKEGFDSHSEQIPFEQEVEICTIGKQYEKIVGNFRGYEWGYQISIYKKEGKVFFVFITGGAESLSYEKRYYWDSEEQLIRFLNKEMSEYMEEESGPGKTVKLDPDKLSLKDHLEASFNDIAFVLEGKSTN